jgi:hypothetical protein
MKVKSSRRLVARLGLALAVAAVAVPSTQAMTMNAMSDGGGSGSVRLYADDLHAASAAFSLPASNVRTDAASLQPSVPGSNVRTDAASAQPVSVPASNVRIDVRTDAASPQPSEPGSNVRTDAASSKPVTVPVSSLASNVRTDAASSVSSIPLTDARHSALLMHRAQIGQPTHLASTQLASTDSTGIDWSVAGIGAALGAFGLMLLFGVLFFAGRHNRRGRLAAT